MHGRFIRIARAPLAALCALAVLLPLAAPALAADPAPPAEGEPTIDGSRPLGYYVWHDAAGFHLRTHGPGDEHRFEARLHTDGVFIDVDSVRLESRDGVAVLDGGHTLVLRTRTFNWTDGVNFRIRGGHRLRLNLQLEGEPIATESIFLGADGRHPANNPFTIRA
jgi:hypothetical protein